jgi:hypothetical protein
MGRLYKAVSYLRDSTFRHGGELVGGLLGSISTLGYRRAMAGGVTRANVLVVPGEKVAEVLAAWLESPVVSPTVITIIDVVPVATNDSLMAGIKE